MAKRSFLGSIRETLANVADSIASFLRSGEGKPSPDPIISGQEIPLPVDEPTPDEEIPDEEVEEEPHVEIRDPYFDFTPEEIEESEEEDFVDIIDPAEIESSQQRRIFANYLDALNYASEIPVDTEVIRRSNDYLYQVIVTYKE